MEHIAIDLGSKESQVCVRSGDGVIVEERRMPTGELRHYLAQRPRARVVMETCSESWPIADAALQSGHEVRVVAATLVRSLGVGARRTKTDRRDAQVLSEVSCRIDLPSVHVSSCESRRRKMMCNMRDTQVRARTQLINCVRGWLRTEAVRIRSGHADLFADRVREHFARVESKVPSYVESVLKSIDQLSKEIAKHDKELAKLAKADPVCRRLMTVPGIGPVASVRFAAVVDDPSRFSGAHELQSYLGLVPGEDSSGERQRRTSITKAGSISVRWLLVQGAWVARHRRQHDPMVKWAAEIEKRRGKSIAVVALARKIAGVLYAIWRDSTCYDPMRGAAKMAA
jgi:transposase